MKQEPVTNKTLFPSDQEVTEWIKEIINENLEALKALGL